MTEKQYRIQEYLKSNAGPHTAKTIGISCGAKSDIYTYATSTLKKLEEAGKVERIESPCQPVRWKWVEPRQKDLNFQG